MIAAEDQRFFEHAGYDLAELGAALEPQPGQQRVERGGSTLSQQLAKLLVTGDERSPARKLRELLYAVEMEQTLGKAAHPAALPRQRALGRRPVRRRSGGRGTTSSVRAHELEPAQAAGLPRCCTTRGWKRSAGRPAARSTWRARNGSRCTCAACRASGGLALAEDMVLLDWRPLWAEPPAGATTPRKDKPAAL